MGLWVFIFSVNLFITRCEFCNHVIQVPKRHNAISAIQICCVCRLLHLQCPPDCKLSKCIHLSISENLSYLLLQIIYELKFVHVKHI